MISQASFTFFINAAMETVAVIFLCIILFSYSLKKQKTPTCIPFCLFVGDLILLLTVNLVTWILDGMFVSPDFHPVLYRLDLILMVFDFFFYCFASVLFYNYVTKLISSIEDTGKKPKLSVIHTLTAVCFVTTAVFASSMFTGVFYYFPDDGYTYYTPAYWVLAVISIPAIWMSCYVVLKNRKKIGRKRCLILLSYLMVPMLLFVTDQFFSLSISYLSLAFIALTIYVGVDIDRNKELMEQKMIIAKSETEKTEMKAHLMMSQIQPHFLYNTLSTIAYLCRKDPADAEAAVNEFSDYLAGNLRSINADCPIPFETELTHVENYLKIQKRRFSDRIIVRYDITVRDFRIPALTLQPIVENAVKHAVEKRLEPTTISISSEETDNEYSVTVQDDGPGFDVTQAPADDRPRLGIVSAKNRLDYMLGGRLETESTKGLGTTVRIIIPKFAKGDKNEAISR